MPTLEAKTHVIVPDKGLDDLKRSFGVLRGEPGLTIAETTLFDDPTPAKESIGFKPPARGITAVGDEPKNPSQASTQSEPPDVHGEIQDFLRSARILGES